MGGRSSSTGLASTPSTGAGCSGPKCLGSTIKTSLTGYATPSNCSAHTGKGRSSRTIVRMYRFLILARPDATCGVAAAALRCDKDGLPRSHLQFPAFALTSCPVPGLTATKHDRQRYPRSRPYVRTLLGWYRSPIRKRRTKSGRGEWTPSRPGRVQLGELYPGYWAAGEGVAAGISLQSAT
jgi:hypothetical protein